MGILLSVDRTGLPRRCCTPGKRNWSNKHWGFVCLLQLNSMCSQPGFLTRLHPHQQSISLTMLQTHPLTPKRKNFFGTLLVLWQVHGAHRHAGVTAGWGLATHGIGLAKDLKPKTTNPISDFSGENQERKTHSKVIGHGSSLQANLGWFSSCGVSLEPEVSKNETYSVAGQEPLISVNLSKTPWSSRAIPLWGAAPFFSTAPVARMPCATASRSSTGTGSKASLAIMSWISTSMLREKQEIRELLFAFFSFLSSSSPSFFSSSPGPAGTGTNASDGLQGRAYVRPCWKPSWSWRCRLSLWDFLG